MTKKTYYECAFCWKSFDTEEECYEHEKTHIKNYSRASNKEIAEQLIYLGTAAYSHRSENNDVMGMPTESFISLLDVAAARLMKRLRKVEDEN